jgi:hypothetical protein
VQRDLDSPTTLDGVQVGSVPAGYVLLPGVPHAYKASAQDLAGYVKPFRSIGESNRDDDADDLDEDRQ